MQGQWIHQVLQGFFQDFQFFINIASKSKDMWKDKSRVVSQKTDEEWRAQKTISHARFQVDSGETVKQISVENYWKVVFGLKTPMSYDFPN